VDNLDGIDHDEMSISFPARENPVIVNGEPEVISLEIRLHMCRRH